MALKEYLRENRYNQSFARYLAPGRANLENFQISRGGGGKLIGFNGQILVKIPKFCLKFFFQQKS
jgi:hypothetical protein